MTNSLQAAEAECAANATAPRVSLSDIEAAISSTHFTTGADVVMTVAPNSPEMNLTVLTICLMVMKNGFVVVGKSAPASRENFNPDLGRKLAREDCIRQLWPLMGFALKERTHVGW